MWGPHFGGRYMNQLHWSQNRWLWIGIQRLPVLSVDRFCHPYYGVQLTCTAPPAVSINMLCFTRPAITCIPFKDLGDAVHSNSSQDSATSGGDSGLSLSSSSSSSPSSASEMILLSLMDCSPASLQISHALLHSCFSSSLTALASLAFFCTLRWLARSMAAACVWGLSLRSELIWSVE